MTPEGVLTDVNRAVLEVAPVDPEQVLGKPLEDTYYFSHSPEVRQRIRAAVRRAVQIRTTVRFEVEARVGDDRFLRIDFAIAPLLGADGEVVALIPSATDVTARSQAEEALQDSQTRLRGVFESGMIGILFWNADGGITDANDAFLQMLGYTRDEVTRRGIGWRDLTPPEWAAVDEKILSELAAAGSCAPFEKEFLRKDGSRVAVLIGAEAFAERPTEGVAYVLDIGAHKQAERHARVQYAVSRVLAEARLQEEAIEQILQEIGQGLGWEMAAFWRVDGDAPAALLRHTRLWHDDAHASEAASLRAVSQARSFAPGEGLPGRAWSRRAPVWLEDLGQEQLPRFSGGENFGLRAGVAFPLRSRGTILGVIELFSVRPRPADDSLLRVFSALGNQIGQFLERMQAEEAIRASEAHSRAILDTALDAIVTMDHQGRITEFNPAAERIFGYRRDDVVGLEMAERIIPPAYRDRHREGLARYLRDGDGPVIGNRFEITAIRSDGTEFPVELAINRIPGEGPPVFTGFIRDITQSKRAEEERLRLLREAERRADREALLNEIGRAQRATDDPEAVQAVAVRRLGLALRADRCYFATYDTARDQARIGRDWHRADLASLAGDYRLADYNLDVEEIFRSGETQVIEDIRTTPLAADEIAARFEALGIRSGVTIPLFEDGHLVSTLNVCMAETPRAWTPEEVALVEAVAAQTRSTLGMVVLLRRERNIAEHLQDALTPARPDRVPGLELADFYRPALEEAKIGGDFFDVFPLQNGCTALVVGDLSGKGLAAASQIATVRNMLRYALYQEPTLADAIANVNKVLVEHDLLTGFASLFVGAYDTEGSTLTYVSCGHEPGLIRRASSGAVEQLMPTGPVLGAFGEVDFDEEVVVLAPGDTVAVYTDGLSEAGRSRHDFLGVEGLGAFLANGTATPPGAERADAVVGRIVAGVEAHTQGVRDDDMCLLVATVLDPEPRTKAFK
jgi:PAS domain S-box-containing protein